VLGDLCVLFEPCLLSYTISQLHDGLSGLGSPSISGVFLGTCFMFVGRGGIAFPSEPDEVFTCKLAGNADEAISSALWEREQ
jgi:hypothetical protein